MTEFVHLHNHTEYSLLDGMLRIAEKGPSAFLKSLAEQKIRAVAMTDHGNMYGAMEFYKNTREVGIKPIVGCEFYTTPFGYTDKTKKDRNHLTVLSKDLEGYHNLMQLNSDAWVDGFYHKPRIDFDLLSKNKAGLIVLSGCLKGELAQTALYKGEEEAIKLALKYQEMLGKGNYYIEIMDHGIPEEQAALKVLLEVAKKTGIPLVATNDCHYEKREDWATQDISMCISMKTTLDDPDRFKMTTHELYFKSGDEMAKLFDYVPEAIKNTLEVAEKCNLEFKKEGFVMPNFEIPPEFANHADFLRFKCIEGLKKKLKQDFIPEDYQKRLDYELEVITKMGFAVYFLIVADFIAYARTHDVPVGPGRGSGAGSIVAYSMDITKLDPLTNKLLFERFLNPDRVSMPDLDIDFSDAGREKVIEYMRNKYGNKNVAQIITFGSMKAKMALKDTARVLGFSVTDTNRLAKYIPEDIKATIKKAIEDVPEIKKEMNSDPKVKQLFEYALKIEGLKRQTGVHAAGLLVTKEEVTKYTPLAKGSKDIITTQFEGNTVSDMGLLKIDFLGLKTLTVIDNTIKMIKELRGIDLDIDTIPLDDKKTYTLLQGAYTTCVFQLESSGMKDLVKRLYPSVFSDISALVALYRPGPMKSGMLDSFVKRKNGTEKKTVDHKLMAPILAETYGTMIYQEQIMEVSKALSGFTPGEADTLRKAMCKKKLDIMEKFRAKFVSGAEKNSVDPKLSNKIFDQMAKFAEYGFNKSHSVAYALVSYQTAYLKANYPIEFMCASLTNEIGHNAIGSSDKENKIVTYLEEARRMGFDILPPDIQHSKATFSVEKLENGKEAIRFGLTAIKNVGEEACKNIVKEREENGPYKDLYDFCIRVNLYLANRKALESFAMAGVFDSLFPHLTPLEARAQLLSDIDPVVTHSITIKQEKEAAATTLFGDGMVDLTIQSKPKLKRVPPLTKAELLNNEKEVLGLYLSGHPLSRFKRHIKKFLQTDISTLQENPTIGTVRVAGIISRIKKRQTKNKDNWAQLAIEDELQSITANAFSKAWEKINGKVEINQAVVVTGDIRGDELSAKPEIMVSNIEPILNVIAKQAAKFTIHIPQDYKREDLNKIKALMQAADGLTMVYVDFEENGKKHLLKLPNRIVIHNSLVNFIEETFGQDSWDFERQ